MKRLIKRGCWGDKGSYTFAKEVTTMETLEDNIRRDQDWVVDSPSF